jgi:hypothetical protein
MTLRLLLIAATLLSAGAASAQPPLSNEEKAGTAPTEPSERTARDVGSIVGETLYLNGSAGAMQIAMGDSARAPLKIVMLKLRGEVISDPQQRCVISIIGDGPLALVGLGAPDGLPRFRANIPVCPLSFDVVDGGVIVPPQAHVCAFKTADCQATPSGVWGPNPFTVINQIQTLAEDRSASETSIAASLRKAVATSPTEKSEIDKQETEFLVLRDQMCVSYEDESTNGFCHSAVTQARAALLRKQASIKPKKSQNK